MFDLLFNHVQQYAPGTCILRHAQLGANGLPPDFPAVAKSSAGAIAWAGLR
jgi:hypothetical protein